MRRLWFCSVLVEEPTETRWRVSRGRRHPRTDRRGCGQRWAGRCASWSGEELRRWEWRWWWSQTRRFSCPRTWLRRILQEFEWKCSRRRNSRESVLESLNPNQNQESRTFELKTRDETQCYKTHIDFSSISQHPSLVWSHGHDSNAQVDSQHVNIDETKESENSNNKASLDPPPTKPRPVQHSSKIILRKTLFNSRFVRLFSIEMSILITTTLSFTLDNVSHVYNSWSSVSETLIVYIFCNSFGVSESENLMTEHATAVNIARGFWQLDLGKVAFAREYMKFQRNDNITGDPFII